jgi:hypothetical protein
VGVKMAKIKWRLIEFAWATVGIVWFILFQLLGIFSEEASINAIVGFGLYMYLVLFITIVAVAYPYAMLFVAKIKKTDQFKFKEDKPRG